MSDIFLLLLLLRENRIEKDETQQQE